MKNPTCTKPAGYSFLKKALIFSIAFSNSQYSFSQRYYPAGLGNTSLQLWLSAADPATLFNTAGSKAGSGDNISRWKDKSGNTNDAVQSLASIQPTWNANQLNGKSAVLFQNAAQYMTGPSDAYQTIAAVRNMPGSGHYQTLFASTANTDNISIRGGGDNSNYTDGPNVNDWTKNTAPANWVNGVQTLSGGAVSIANHILIASASVPTNSTYSINSTFLDRGMNGNDAVYELLAYSSTLNTTQRILLENYEATTWGLDSLLTSAGHRFYIAPTAATFNQNLIGIGSSGATDNFLSNKSGMTDGLAFSSGTSATDFLFATGYVMAAHNGQTNTTRKNVSLTGIAPLITLWNRSWNIQLAGGNTSGNLTLSFIFNDYKSGSSPAENVFYYLLYNPIDGTFSSETNSAIKVNTTVASATSVSFTVKASVLGPGFYTLSSSTNSILPFSISSFHARNQDNQGLIEWTTPHAAGLTGFQVERSTDQIHFVSLDSLLPQKVYDGENHYSFTDSKPQPGGNYYRLKMIDRNGGFSYSEIDVVNFDNPHVISLYAYPNPARDQIAVFSSTLTGPSTIRLFNMEGNLLFTGHGDISHTYFLSIRDQKKGIYILKIDNAQNSYNRKISKE